MAELLRSARQGWHIFNGDGKLAAALLISLAVLWVYYKSVRQKTFLIYTTAVTLLCVLPVSGAVLMLYQTGFYDYRWIWSIVPMTAMIAFAITLILTEFLQGAAGRDRKKQIFAAAMIMTVLCFCGGMGVRPWAGFGRQERQQAEEILAELKDKMQTEQICLWAPREVMEYARAYDGGIELLYGRNMWEPALNAYSYESYSQEVIDLYRWMEAMPWEETADAADCARAARSAGANCILLPGDKAVETVACFEEELGVRAQEIGSYLLFVK